MTHPARTLHVDGTDRSRGRLERLLRECDDRFEIAGVDNRTAPEPGGTG